MSVLSLPVAAITALAGAIVYFWKYITYYFSHYIKDWIAKYISTTVADMLAEFIFFIDDKIVVPTRRALKALWKNFKKYILDWNTTYQENDDGTYTARSELLTIAAGSNKPYVTTHQIEWEDLPSSVRHKQLRENADKIVISGKDIMEEQFVKKAQEKFGMSRQELVLEN